MGYRPEIQDAIFDAIKVGNVEKLQFLIHKSDLSLSAIQKENSVSLVLMAIERGCLDIVKYLIKNGLSLKVKNDHDDTPAHLAAAKGCLDILKFLKEKGCSLKHENDSGHKPIHVAAKNGHLDVLKYFKEKGYSLKSKNYLGHKPVHFAASGGHLDILKYLKEKGCSFKVKNDDGDRPVHRAAKNGHLDVLKYFQEEGCSMEVCNEKGDNPFHIAAQNDRLEVLEWLMKEQKCSFNVSSDTFRRHIILSAQFYKLTTLIFVFPSLCDSFNQASELEKVLNLAEEKHSLCVNADDKNEIYSCYATLITQFLNQGENYDLILKSYYKMNCSSAFAFCIPLFLNNHKNEEAIAHCLNLIENGNKSTHREEARIQLAELLLRHDADMEEENSPLERQHDYLLANQNQVIRILQAYYLLLDCKSMQATQLKNRFHQILSGHSQCDSDLKASVKTWENLAVHFYHAYHSYKQNPGDEELSILINRSLDEILEMSSRFDNPSRADTDKRLSGLGEQGMFHQEKIREEALLVSTESVITKNSIGFSFFLSTNENP